MQRRRFLDVSSQAVLTLAGAQLFACGSRTVSEAKQQVIDNAPLFEISLAEWSLNKSLFAGKMTNLDFAAKAKHDFGIGAIEYVNQFFKDKANDQDYLAQLNQRASDLDVKQLIIMIDGEGGLAELDDNTRTTAVENHYKWIEAAKTLGCHSIRVNAYGEGNAEEVGNAAVDGLGRLASFAKDYEINVIVENHGGYSSNGAWLSGVMQQINMDNCGTLPDFGNFCIRRAGDDCEEEYDRYQGVQELMPFAKSVSAKSHDFADDGTEIHTDFLKMMQIVKDAGYQGYVGIEYEGSSLSEDDGIMKTKQLLEDVFSKLT